MIKIAKVFLGISIISFIIAFGSCVGCVSSQSAVEGYVLPDGSLQKGVNETERAYTKAAAASFGISVIAACIALLLRNIDSFEKRNRKANRRNKRR
jgi:ABC-type molybdate transport system substrate-binding protein